jgi:hypothetical protein
LTPTNIPPTPTNIPSYTVTAINTPTNTLVSNTPTATNTPRNMPTSPTNTISISLGDGWNLVSIPIHPDSTAIADALASIVGSYSDVRLYDGCDPAEPWKIYDPSAPAVVNDLTAIDETMALWIKMTVTDTLVVTGTEPVSTTIPLCTGWNLVGYPSRQERDIAELLDSYVEAYTLVNAYKVAEPPPWKRFDPNAPPYANTLNEMQPGFGYWIKVNQDIDLIINNQSRH